MEKNKQKNQFSKKIINWYKKNKRAFPWREKIHPYGVLISEILLQHTDAKKVSLIYKDFLLDFPDLSTLAKSRVSVIRKKIWYLGKHHRAKDLKKIANQLLTNNNGRIPNTEKELLKLKGIGPYSANAILSFGFNKNVPIVDTNVIRILNRYFDLDIDYEKERKRKKIWIFANSLLPKHKIKEYHWGLLDLGSQICKPKKPICNRCPLLESCIYNINNTPIK